MQSRKIRSRCDGIKTTEQVIANKKVSTQQRPFSAVAGYNGIEGAISSHEVVEIIQGASKDGKSLLI